MGFPFGGWRVAPLISFSMILVGMLGANCLKARIPTCPEQWEGSPICSCSSKIVTERPRRAAATAALAPLTPHPTIAMSAESACKFLFTAMPCRCSLQEGKEMNLRELSGLGVWLCQFHSPFALRLARNPYNSGNFKFHQNSIQLAKTEVFFAVPNLSKQFVVCHCAFSCYDV